MAVRTDHEKRTLKKNNPNCQYPLCGCLTLLLCLRGHLRSTSLVLGIQTTETVKEHSKYTVEAVCSLSSVADTGPQEQAYLSLRPFSVRACLWLTALLDYDGAEAHQLSQSSVTLRNRTCSVLLAIAGVPSIIEVC